MGQQISLSDLEFSDIHITNNQLSSNEIEDIHLFLPFHIIDEINNNSITLSDQNSSNKFAIRNEMLIKKIRNDISNFSELSDVKQFDTKISEMIKKRFDHIAKLNLNLQNDNQSTTNKQKQLQDSYAQKLKDNENEMTSIFSETSTDSVEHMKELSFIAVQSLISMLLILLESVHQSDSRIIHRMLNLTNELVEQIPLNCLSSDIYKRSDNLFKSLKPLTNYIENLSEQTHLDSTAANKSIQILLNFAVLRASFKDILTLIRKLFFNTTDIFDLRKLFIKLNNQLTTKVDQSDCRFQSAVEYLQSIQAYPNTNLIALNQNQFTGQFICSVLFVHIDLHNQFHTTSKFEQNSMNSSFSFELEMETFRYLYELIEALFQTNDFNYIFNVCLRLFTTHVRFLISANLENFHDFFNENDLEKWSTMLFQLTLNNQSDERKNEASQALIYLIEKQTLSFSQILSFCHEQILKNQCPILIDQLLKKLNQHIFLYKWIEVLCNNDNTGEDRTLAFTILDSFMSMVLESTSVDEKKIHRLREMLIMFQQLFLVYLTNQSVDTVDELESSAASTLAMKYATHIIKFSLQTKTQTSLFESLILGLCTLTDMKFSFATIQPIFTGIIPLLSEYIKQIKTDVDNRNSYLISWLLSKMSYRLIIGPPQSFLEQKYNQTLKSPLFSGGYETLTNDRNAYLTNLFESNLTKSIRFTVPFRRQQSIINNHFLQSIYNNTNPGAQLIAKIKLFIRDKHILQTSIENIANDACAAVFAAYIKHYRRIELAQYELSQSILQRPHPKLLVLYEYANEVRRSFANTKARGGDCDELCRKIKSDALLLLVSIRESSFIMKIREDYLLSPSTSTTRKIQFLRQQSHWTKVKSLIRLLRNTFNACLRLKYFQLEKKQDSESLMHQAISNILYGNEQFSIDPNEIVQCLTRQYQRAMTRLIIYEFILSNQDVYYLLFLNLKEKNFDWHYLDHIQATHIQLKEDIGRLYYKIVKNILSISFESNVKILRVFNLINFNYNSMDFCFLNEFQLINLIENIDLGFHWFRLVVLKLCENIELEKLRNQNLGNRKSHQILQQQCHLIFNKFFSIQLKQKQIIDEQKSLENLSSFQSSNRYLSLLLRCIHFYEHIRLNYATIEYIQLLFDLYQTSSSLTTRLLTLKVLRDLLTYVRDETNRNFIENLLEKILLTIGQAFNSFETVKIEVDLVIELIYIYRQILSLNSPWLKFATILLINSIKFGMNIDLQQTNLFLGAICILGGYYQPYCLGSTVEIYPINKDTDEIQFGVIMKSNSSDEESYLIQYATQNETEWISSNQLHPIVDVQLPNLSLLPIDNALHSILDTLGCLIEISANDFFTSLNIKYRVVKALHHILKHKQVIDIFMDKPYASILAKLSTMSTDLEVKDHDPIVLEYLYKPVSINQKWKSIATKNEIQSYRKGRLGKHDIQIVSLPTNDPRIKYEECGTEHKFQGRVIITDDTGDIQYRTFIPDGIELNEGKWYFCVRLPLGGTATIGWATQGFNLPVHNSSGFGDEKYSWGASGNNVVYRGILSFLFNAERSWTKDVVCGCGIEIDGLNTNIKYWINGQFSGTLYSHSDNTTIKSSSKANLTPNGMFASYFPVVLIKVHGNVNNTGHLEFIFSPDDMTECPLPDGYKPLLMPKFLSIENLLVAYPSNAYLIGNHIQEYFYTNRFIANHFNNKNISLLRDFVNNQHFEVPFDMNMISADDCCLKLSKENNGFLWTIDNHQQLTITFEFQIFENENHSDEFDIILFKLDDTICSTKISNFQSSNNVVVIQFQINEQIKVYINKKIQTLNSFLNSNSKLNLHLLPNLNVGIGNLAVWEYLLSEEHIQRLFTYGISYVSIDYQKLKTYRQQFNKIEFTAEQKYFSNEILIPLNEPFREDLWIETKRSIREDESNYFETIPNTNQSVVQLFGNRTYLVLDTADQIWSEYTLILDILIQDYPSTNAGKLTILSVNDTAEIYVTHDGYLHVTDDYQSSVIVPLREDICLFISIQTNSIHIYINDCLAIDTSITLDQFATKLKRIDLFRELDLTKSTINDSQLRLTCRSITYLNKYIESFSDQLIVPSFNILSTNLIGIGYKQQSIEYVLNKYQTTNLYLIDKILREEAQTLENICQQNRFAVLRRLKPYDQYGLLPLFIDNDELTTKKDDDDDTPSDMNWFYDTVRSVNICQQFDDWLQNRGVSHQLTILTKIYANQIESINNKPKKTKSIVSDVARDTILQMIKVWSDNNDQSNLFPLLKFGNESFPGRFVRLMNEDINEMDLLMMSIIKTELKESIKCTPLLFQLHKQILDESIDLLTEPSLFDIDDNNNNDIAIRKQPNFGFILKLSYLFSTILNDFEGQNGNNIDLIIEVLFPSIFIRILFELFLLVPSHQVKIFILGIFSQLIQTSENFKLHNDIRHFFHQLLRHLSVNEIYVNSLTIIPFRRSLVKLQISLIEQDKQLISSSNNEWSFLPDKLAITFDLSNILTNKIKSSQCLDLLFIQSKEILNEKLALPKESIETAFTYFDRTVDEQVMIFMNQNIKYDDESSSKQHIIEFIENLLTEAKYTSFICSTEIPSKYIQIRVAFLYLFSVMFAVNVPKIRFEIASGLDFIVDRIRSVRQFILVAFKFMTLDEVLTETTVELDSSDVIIEFDIVKASLAEHFEYTMFYQAYKQLKSEASQIFRRKQNEQVWKAVYVGMHSDDQGGPYRDSLTRMCADLCSIRLPLFILCPNGRTNSGLNRDRWIPNLYPSNRPIPMDIKNQYRFVGQLMGMAIRTKLYLDVRFPILLWKQLLGEEVTVEDIEAIDISCFAIINELQTNFQKVKGLHEGDYVFNSIMTEFKFDVISSTGQNYELIPGGFHIPITADNFEDYCRRYRQYRINEFYRQIEYIRQGLYSVVPSTYLSLFIAQELEEIVCGKGFIDIQMLQRHTNYENDDESSPHIQNFWSILSEMFSEEQKKLFLIFVWGRTTLPYTDDDFSTDFTITRLGTDGNVDEIFPRSYTCSFTLQLPVYSTKEIMYERLNYAITYCSTIDIDRQMN